MTASLSRHILITVLSHKAAAFRIGAIPPCCLSCNATATSPREFFRIVAATYRLSPIVLLEILSAGSLRTLVSISPEPYVKITGKYRPAAPF
ncbi:hypothetical protein K440DRAFT_632958 [Wilcoxina mikolae CBS 423.85]|nr:hypothetical protein K440DRAFT_632958 [Wilcoxina mikolae CBS 423.85]